MLLILNICACICLGGLAMASAWHSVEKTLRAKGPLLCIGEPRCFDPRAIRMKAHAIMTTKAIVIYST